MKLYIFFLFGILQACFCQTNPNHVYVRGYTRSDGTQVQGHYRTAPNSTVNDNFSTIGNVNPYTGESGYLPRDGGTLNSSSYLPSYNTYNYSSPSANSYSTRNSTAWNTTLPEDYPYSTSRYRSNLGETDLLKERIKYLEEELMTERQKRIELENLSVNDTSDSISNFSNAVVEESVIDSAQYIANYDVSSTKTDNNLIVNRDDINTSTSQNESNGSAGFFIVIGIGIFILLLFNSGK